MTQTRAKQFYDANAPMHGSQNLGNAQMMRQTMSISSNQFNLQNPGGGMIVPANIKKTQMHQKQFMQTMQNISEEVLHPVQAVAAAAQQQQPPMQIFDSNAGGGSPVQQLLQSQNHHHRANQHAP